MLLWLCRHARRFPVNNNSFSFRHKPRIEQLYNALALVMLVLLPLSLTYVQWGQEKERVEREAKIEFEFRAREATNALHARMLAYEQVLRGAAGVFAIADNVTRDEWREYVLLLQVSKNYPGIAAIGYAPIVPADRLDEFVARIRKLDLPSYEVWRKGDRSPFAPTLYIEPLTDRNLRALGFDLYSDATRSAALNIARDSGDAALSARITLAQDAGDDARTGVAMYVPIYNRGTEPATVVQRRVTLTGFVSGGFRMNELLDDLFGERPGLDLRIYDGMPDPAAVPLAKILPRNETMSSAPRFKAQQRLDFAQRIWTLQFASTLEFERDLDYSRPRLVLIGGLLMSVLLVAFIWSLSTTRDRAVKLARQMTLELNENRDALRASGERLNLALQGSSLALFDWDVTTGAVHLSEQWAMMLGNQPQETTTTVTALEQLVHPDDLPRLRQELREALRGQSGDYRVEHRVKSHRGEWIWIFSRAKVVARTADGRPLRVTGTNADISERKQIEKMKDEFIGTVSHELRTPLTAILGALGLLRASDTPDSGNARMLLDMAYQNSERLAALINDVLDTEKLEAGMMAMQIAPTALGPFLHRAVELNRSYADRYNVHYELRGPIPVVSVSADPDRLMQVITNLLSNATKFSPAGAAVTIAASVLGDRVRVTVTDTGPGIPPEFRDRIFQKFAQADASSTRQKGGTGLGLWICQAIVEKLGGHIGYESEPGKGTTFYFELPAGTNTA